MASPPDSALQNPIPGTTIDTSPDSLGLTTDPHETDGQYTLSRSSSGSFVKRTVGKTMEKLSRSGSRAHKSEDYKSPSHKRIFSLSRKSKDQESISTDDYGDENRLPKRSQNSGAQSTSSSPNSSHLRSLEDSPFVRPLSPQGDSPQLSRPSLINFRGSGSLRAGTQTLIQAIQAAPWTDEPEHEEGDEMVSSEDDKTDTEDEGPTLASSIHTIHRPIARIRRGDTPFVSQTPGQDGEYFGYDRGVEIEQIVEEPAEELIEDDFEFSVPRSPARGKEPSHSSLKSPPARAQRGPILRSGSMATVRIQRRAKLAIKLSEIFEIDDIEEVVAEMPCWLLRSVLLQGYLYLTNAHLCFFAHIPARENQVLKSGSLNKRAQRTKRWIKYWFVLKNDVLSWYNSSSDPYFPRGVVDLRYAISCDPTGEKGIKLRTNDRSVSLSADSVPSRDEWVKAIRKLIFKAQNMGESVKIAIPYSLIVDVDRSSAMDFSETLEVKVVEQGANYSVDSYFFAYFQDLPRALEQIRDVVRSYRQSSPHSSVVEVKDTTSTRSIPTSVAHQTGHVTDRPGTTEFRTSNFKFTSLFKTFSAGEVEQGHPSSSEHREDFTRLDTAASLAQDDSSSSVSTLPGRPGPIPIAPSGPIRKILSTSQNPPPENKSSSSPSFNVNYDHTYPPPPSPGPSPLGEPPQSSWNVGVPSWLRVPGRVFSSITSFQTASSTNDRVQEVYSPRSEATSVERSSSNMGFSMIEAREAAADPDVVHKFHASFALDDRETLLGCIPGYLFRALPVSGKFYISTIHLCFRSSQPLTKTRMIIPLRDVLTSERSKGYRFGMQGLVVIIKGHEELFFEFHSVVRRDSFAELLENQLESLRDHPGRNLQASPSLANREALFLEELETPGSLSDSDPVPPPETQTDTLPAVMFTSSSSTFLTFKPRDPLHFTFLTIGSRGDVQPYIALGKRLLQEGHRVRIATHSEFKEWIEAHNIEFAYVGGDPAELMRICVENGVFTVSFLKESAAKFRGWIDDLLKTSWEACQGTDVLIESPSAMGGIHIAEALKIPYFRAFTMPWTRTRAYPHAFAVPERKMGGSYNYMTYVMFDQVFWRATSGQINRWRKKVLGLGSTGLDRMEQHKVPFLYNFSSIVVPPPLDWYEWIRVTGYWFLDDADVGTKTWSPPPDLLRFIDLAHAAGKKVVYIGFGSIVVSDPEAMSRCVVEAIVKSGVHAILSKGWSDRLSTKKHQPTDEHEAPLPAQIYSISSVPHDWLFARIDAACHHGGAGTTGASLKAGIPTIIKPFFGDQFFWSDRVEALGIGSGVRKLTVENLTSALVTATTDAKQISRAKLVGQQIRAEDGVGKAVEAIYRDLEYARSLIKHRDDSDAEILNHGSRPPSRDNTTNSSNGSARGGATSEDWSVVSDQDDQHHISSLGESGSTHHSSV